MAQRASQSDAICQFINSCEHLAVWLWASGWESSHVLTTHSSRNVFNRYPCKDFSLIIHPNFTVCFQNESSARQILWMIPILSYMTIQSHEAPFSTLTTVLWPTTIWPQSLMQTPKYKWPQSLMQKRFIVSVYLWVNPTDLQIVFMKYITFTTQFSLWHWRNNESL